ncbi:unnamed protein product [Cuscuta epithymum]|uniref:F-box domain-containing protein n=1 Tax=Cuscuta epithymum TaxID=186058 RepID=A0AAV0EFB3_9ASTE|nr:unnamed protein product [Cuscuta epithymum]
MGVGFPIQMRTSLLSLPEELKIDILMRLPIESLICLSAVSKPWLSYLTSSEFVSAHLSEGATKQFFFATTTGRNRRFALIKDGDRVDRDLTVQFVPIIKPDQQFQDRFSISFHPCEATGIEIVGSFDGLLCLTFTHPNSHPSIILWNPSIRRHVLLPPPSIHTPRRGGNGIGFCVASDGDYRVVWVHERHWVEERHANSAMSVEIYSLNSGKWRIRRFDDDLFPTRWLLSGQAFVGGKMHWLGCQYDEGWTIESDYAYEMCDTRDNCSITSFHIDEEVFGDVPLPNRFKRFDWPARQSIAVVKDSLGLIDMTDPICCDIWVMQDYGNVNSWAMLYSIGYPDYDDKRLPLMDALNTWKNPGVSAGAHQSFSFMDHEAFVVYGEYGDNRFEYVAKYVESLVLLGHKDAVADVHLLQATAEHMAEEIAGDGQEN